MTTYTKKRRRSNVSLDQIGDRFRENPTTYNAQLYRDVALEYWQDEMIGDCSLLAALHEIKGKVAP